MVRAASLHRSPTSPNTVGVLGSVVSVGEDGGAVGVVGGNGTSTTSLLRTNSEWASANGISWISTGATDVWDVFSCGRDESIDREVAKWNATHSAAITKATSDHATHTTHTHRTHTIG